MRLKASIDYGLRAVLYLARKGTTCSSKDIAEDMSIPRDYLIQLAQSLRNAGIIEARPGKYGGYLLARSPKDVTVLDVLDALEDDAKRSREKHDERMAAVDGDDVRRTCALVESSINAYLDSLTIEVLLKCADDDEDTNEFLSKRLLEESERLAGANENGK